MSIVLSRKILEEKSVAEQERSSMERRYTEVVTKINSLLNIDLGMSFSISSMDSLFNKVYSDSLL